MTTETHPDYPMKAGYGCNYCDAVVEIDISQRIYGPKSQDYGLVHVCTNENCGAYVGCHKDTDTPKGLLANAVTRAYRMAAHAVIDPLWRKKMYERAEVYRILGEKMGVESFHVGNFDADQCVEVIRIAKSMYPSGGEQSNV
jgi:hypothetical protein